ncbi:Zn(2)-C6 fungal-type domain-containing protein [Favolaschia claudopus]|uniref:Zn(2)-C6 fungal-type domain-containing protein n=1 Tax=Favolaschia claudopus TaxID=2862362 RepID=A0AAW0D2E2_9AGAR
MAPEKRERCQPLRRGRACLNCRHLKIKCNGVRPICAPCMRVPKDDPCEYTDTMSRTERLERTVSRLQARLHEMQGLGSSTATKRPSISDSSNSSSGSPTFISHAIPPASRSSPSNQSVSPPPTLNDSTQEPPFGTSHMLLESFLPHSPPLGFFLHTQRFRDSIANAEDHGSNSALLYVVSLWGAHLTQGHTPLRRFEPIFLKRARQCVAVEMAEITAADPFNSASSSNPLLPSSSTSTSLAADSSPSSSSSPSLHTLQALILLSTYLLRTNRLLEAEFYASGAATVARALNLHKQSSINVNTSANTIFTDDVYPPQFSDPVSEGERIRAFWAVACLQIYLSCSLVDTPLNNNNSILDSATTDMETPPWPFEMGDYEVAANMHGAMMPFTGYAKQDDNGFSHPLTMEDNSSRTLSNPNPNRTSPPMCTLHSKASVLFHHATRLCATSSTNPMTQQDPFHTYQQQQSYFLPDHGGGMDATNAYHLLDRRLTAFWSSLPPIYAFNNKDDCCDTATSQPRCSRRRRRRRVCSLRGAIIDSLAMPLVVGHRHPIVGSLCALACGVLMEEILYVRAVSGGVGGEAAAMPSEPEMSEVLKKGVRTMEGYAVGCPLIQHQLKKVLEQYAAL